MRSSLSIAWVQQCQTRRGHRVAIHVCPLTFALIWSFHPSSRGMMRLLTAEDMMGKQRWRTSEQFQSQRQTVLLAMVLVASKNFVGDLARHFDAKHERQFSPVYRLQLDSPV